MKKTILSTRRSAELRPRNRRLPYFSIRWVGSFEIGPRLIFLAFVTVFPTSFFRNFLFSLRFQFPATLLLSYYFPTHPSWQRKDSLLSSVTSTPAKAEYPQCTPLSPPKNWLAMLTKTVNRTQKNADDVVITLAIRTPLTKGFKGGMKDTPLDFIVYQLLKKVIEKSRIDPQMVEDICLGNVSFGRP